jgi:hypothetical protein
MYQSHYLLESVNVVPLVGIAEIPRRYITFFADKSKATCRAPNPSVKAVLIRSIDAQEAYLRQICENAFQSISSILLRSMRK